MSMNAVRRFSPITLSLMEFRNQREVNIVEAVYDHHPLIGEQQDHTWNLSFTQEFNMTGDSNLFCDRESLRDQGCVMQADGTWVNPDSGE